MTIDSKDIDRLLAAALRGERVAWPVEWTDGQQVVIERIAYHGIAGLLNEQAAILTGWPNAVTDTLRDQSIGLAMWEMRHKVVLSALLGALGEAGIMPLLLKGTAMAYDLYALPATRARGDTDLLVAKDDLVAARRVFTNLGYALQPLEVGIADDLALQEVWSIGCSAGTRHSIDLHWQLINAPALAGLLDFAACAVVPHPLPRLHPNARAMSRPLTLLHSCIHRAMHLTSPYFVDGVTYYGGDRLIWARDIDYLARALSPAEWEVFAIAAIEHQVAAVCDDGLDLARRTMGTVIPDGVARSLSTASGERASAYLLGAGQAWRAWLDLAAILGFRRKLAYIAARSLPSPVFMRGKYPELANRPLAVLHLRRMIDLVRPRPAEERRG